MQAIVFTKTPSPILSNDKRSMVEKAWNPANTAHDCQQALAGAPAGTPSDCQLPSGPSLKISFGFCLMLFYQIYDIDYAPNYT